MSGCKGAGMNIYLLRHGETAWNKEGRIQGHTDIPLNQHGKMQIAQTAAGLADICPNMDLILCSPLSRARESARIAADKLSYPRDKIIEEPLLIERCFGEAEGLTAAEREEKYPNYHYSDTGYYFPGMEPFDDLVGRVRDAIKRIENLSRSKKNTLVVSHGAFLAAVITVVTDGRITYFSDAISLDSGSLFRIRHTDKAAKLAKYSIESTSFIDINF